MDNIQRAISTCDKVLELRSGQVMIPTRNQMNLFAISCEFVNQAHRRTRSRSLVTAASGRLNSPQIVNKPTWLWKRSASQQSLRSHPLPAGVLPSTRFDYYSRREERRKQSRML
ncbi:hypothetical protein RRG08_019075 [Elysia crispata]|uniref:Uncharacterized protein n=1 Tax=Elysia crispata TaxID=231223 RepID=A0AAE1A5H8_9GAST|nr:hypothetical protein RRG08_019075 [Elysia crispata]